MQPVAQKFLVGECANLFWLGSLERQVRHCLGANFISRQAVDNEWLILGAAGVGQIAVSG
jgi:hypothetical protein